MEFQKVMLFIRVCVLYVYYGYLTGLTNEELICLLEECLVMALFLHDTNTERIIYVQLGHLYKNIHHHLAKALDVAQKTIGHKKPEMGIYRRLGIAYQSVDKYHVAIKYQERCLGIATEIGDKQGKGYAYGNLGNAYYLLAKYHEAIKYHEKCLSIVTEIGDRWGEGAACGSLGNVYESLGKNHEAIRYLERSLSIATEMGDTQREGVAYGSLGNVYDSLGKYHEAIRYHEKCLCIVTKKGDRRGEGSAYGSLGNAYQSLGKYPEAIQYYEKCLHVVTKIGDRREEGNAYGSLGNVYKLLGKYQEAIEYHEKSLRIATDISDRHGEESAYGGLGNAYRSLGRYHEAIRYYERCIGIATEIGDRGGEGSAYGSLGNAYQSLGKYHEAIKYHKIHLSIATEIGDRRGEENTYGNLGNTCDSLGNYHEAIKYHEMCLSIAMEIGDRNGESAAYRNLGNAYSSLGKYYKAIKYHEKCIGFTIELGDREGESAAYQNLGNAYQSLGKYHEAIMYHEKCLIIATEIGDRCGEGAACGSLGNANRELRNYNEAIKYSEKHLSIATEIGDIQGKGRAYGYLGNAYQSLGKYHEAIKCHEKCLLIATEIGDRRGEGAAYASLGNAYRELRNYNEAITYSEKLLSIATETGDRQGEGISHHNIGLCHEYYGDADHLKKSKEHLYKSIQCFELLFDDLKEKDQLKISIFDTFINVYKNLSRLCLRNKQTEEALLVSERGRARALRDLLSLKYSMNKETASKGGSLKLTDVNDIMVPTSCILFYDVPFGTKEFVMIWVLAHQNPSFFACNKIKIAEPTSAEHKFKNEYNTECITYFVKKSYDDMQVREGVDCEDRSILEYEQQNFVKPPEPESSQVAELITPKGNEIEDKVQARCAYEEDFEDEKPLELLFELLVAPVQHKLIQEEIIVIPDGSLFMVPFAALRDPKTGKFLSEMKRIRLSPSLTTFKLLQESSDDRHYKSGALIVGNPEIGEVKFRGKEKSFNNLPGAEEEANEIAKLLNVKPLTGRQATKEAVLQKLQDGVSVIHFAAHGSENGQILLAPSKSSATNCIPEEHDYILTMQEAQESGVRAQLVVLSCCHSGRGEIKAEGVVGLTRAFLAAGARAVLASLWAIDDNATRVFMLKYYSHLKKGESASKSLQQAMKEMRETERYKEPRHWAAFFLIGDDVSISI